MKHVMILIGCMLLYAPLHAQYTSQGKIEYAKKVNVYAQWEGSENNTWFEQVKGSTPKFCTTYFDLFFDTHHSIYRAGRAGEPLNNIAQSALGPVSTDIVRTDFATQKVDAYKEVYEDKFLVSDSMRHIKWKITDELRTIANYHCRKAVGIICDSVYIVAFYTDDIMVSGGPEMACGLPGMILELAVPRLHTTWTATNIDIALPKDADFTLPEKGRKVTEQELFEKVQKSVKDWGSSGQKSIWWTML